ncbi:MAG: lysoplasmalogenase [Clostridia bacterium]|nr:lysoplasmalogenase [Clostridia bacterium]
MKKTFLILNIIFGFLTILSLVFYGLCGGLWLKGVTSAGFVLQGVANVIYICLQKDKNIKFASLMLTGLVLSLIADVVLNVFFMVGALIFASAHILYVIAYSVLSKYSWKDLIYASIIFVPSALVITLVPLFDFGGILMEIICVVYALIISLMVGKAVSNLIKEKSATNIIIVIGSVLFFISDLMLLFDVFAKVPHSTALIFDCLCLATYWPAQILLAYSIFHKTTESKKE